MIDHIANEILKTNEILHAMKSDMPFLKNVENIAEVCISSFKKNGKILLAGNGGSAGDAQHIAGELVSRFNYDRPPLPAIALTTDTSILTAIGNDYGYEDVFSRQIEALGKPGDIFIAYSTSGKSKNILKALNIAKSIGLINIGMIGSSENEMSPLCDFTIRIPSLETPKIQEGHLVIGHIICSIIEKRIFPKGKN
jgi:D-sedoheptulose 7-phosphate isomerase